MFTSCELETLYTDILSGLFGVAIMKTSFSDPSEACVAINYWVASTIHNRITRLIDIDNLSVHTPFVLINTIYFNSSWEAQFLEIDT